MTVIGTTSKLLGTLLRPLPCAKAGDAPNTTTATSAHDVAIVLRMGEYRDKRSDIILFLLLNNRVATFLGLQVGCLAATRIPITTAELLVNASKATVQPFVEQTTRAENGDLVVVRPRSSIGQRIH